MENNIFNTKRPYLNRADKKKLNKDGYLGFTITAIKKFWKHFSVTAKNKHGQTVTATGESLGEAYQSIVENINSLVQESWQQ